MKKQIISTIELILVSPALVILFAAWLWVCTASLVIVLFKKGDKIKIYKDHVSFAWDHFFDI